MSPEAKLFTMNDSKSHLTKAVPLDSQKLAMEFANEVANERLAQIKVILEKTKTGTILPVDALFEIRAITSKR